MYSALVLACWMGTAQPCIQVTDTRGPYKTSIECETRITEMIMTARAIWDKLDMPYRVVDTACVKGQAGSRV